MVFEILNVIPDAPKITSSKPAKSDSDKLSAPSLVVVTIN
jgi:hypothetical protein